MKHFFLLLTALVATTALWAGNVITYTATSKLPETKVQNSNGLHTNAFNVTITSHSFSNGTGTITFAGEVTSIGDWAFYSCDSLTSITIPNSVTSIGDYVFYWCFSLASVTIPNRVSCIGKGAFFHCTSLTIPDSVSCIGYKAFYHCTSLTSITIPNSVTSIGYEAFGFVNNIVYNGSATGSPWGAMCVNGYIEGYLVYKDTTKTTLCGCSSAATGDIILPNSVTYIGKRAFESCTSLTSITIPHSVTSIGDWAFNDCTSLKSITCFATTPPACGLGCFYNIDNCIPLSVPAGSIKAYQKDDEWKDFTNILPITAEEVPTVTDVVTTPADNSVTITWPTNTDANDYTIEIKKDGEVFCTLTFNAQGQLTSIAFAPSRGNSNDVAMAEAVAGGYRFTITSLTPSTTYTYAVDTKNAEGTSIANYTGEFTTTGATALEEILNSQKSKVESQKVMMDGRMYIMREGKMYNAQGAEL